MSSAGGRSRLTVSFLLIDDGVARVVASQNAPSPASAKLCAVDGKSDGKPLCRSQPIPFSHAGSGDLLMIEWE